MAASVAKVTAVNPKAIKAFLANGASTFFINGKPIAINGKKIENYFYNIFYSFFVIVISVPKTFLKFVKKFREILAVFIISLSDTFLLNKSSALLAILSTTLS